jgi:hypothetical protein
MIRKENKHDNFISDVTVRQIKNLPWNKSLSKVELEKINGFLMFDDNWSATIVSHPWNSILMRDQFLIKAHFNTINIKSSQLFTNSFQLRPFRTINRHFEMAGVEVPVAIDSWNEVSVNQIERYSLSFKNLQKHSKTFKNHCNLFLR